MRAIRSWIRSTGRFAQMIRAVFHDICTQGVNTRELSRQIVKIGLDSLPIVLLTSLFTGMVMALQTAYGLHRFGARNYVGNLVGLAEVRELAPVLTSIMLCGRVGAGIAAELASMVVTEQVDAMRALGANPIRKLVSPKILAAIISLPLLVVCANFIGVYGGAIVAVYELNISIHTYWQSILYTLLIRDVLDGLIKAAFFGFILSSIACYKGLGTRGGTEGVGLTVTEAAVTGSILIFIGNFFITRCLLMVG